MSCRYCGGDNCGSSAGGQSMCDDSAVHSDSLSKTKEQTNQETNEAGRRLTEDEIWWKQYKERHG